MKASGATRYLSQEWIVLFLAATLFLRGLGLPRRLHVQGGLRGFVSAVSKSQDFQLGNLIAMVRAVSVLGILAVGMGIVIIGRGIDLGGRRHAACRSPGICRC